MNQRYRCLSAAFLITLIALAPLAQAALDTPSISLGASGHGKQALTVVAGASGLPNGFTLWWMDAAQFASYNQQWPSSQVSGQGYAMFTGEPTLNTFDGAHTTFQLGANADVVIEIGDLADETGVAGRLGELQYGKTYFFVAFANDANGNAASGLSNTVAGTTTESTNCTYTQGYWKNHPNKWPVSSLTIGSPGYVYSASELMDILDEPVNGNGLISLAHQLIAALLNIANGADPSAASAAIASAHTLIGSLVIPPVGGGYLDPSDTSALTQILDDYNNGLIGPGHCGAVPVRPTTWGQVKSLYR